MEETRVFHTLKPVYDANARVLILGTMPSPRSRAVGFYYSHPQNSFWRVMAAVFCAAPPVDNAEKERFLYTHRLALWDVLHSCEITGAADSSIKNPVANDLSEIFAAADIRAVFTTGMTATRLYREHCSRFMPSVYLPSTSPANRQFGFAQLVDAYAVIRQFCEFTEK